MINECPTILVPPPGESKLHDRILEICPGARLITRDELDGDESLLAKVDVVYGGLKRELYPKAKKLRWLQSTGAGAGWAQVPEVLSHPVVITNARIHAEQISEHLFGLLLMLTHRFNQAIFSQQEHQWRSPDDIRSLRTLRGQRLCILGLGVIGGQCAVLGAAFGMTVVGVRRNPRPDGNCEQVVGPDQIDGAMSGANVVMNLLPGTSDTEKMVGPDQLDALADGSYLLNAGRGSTVDTDAMIAALQSGKLAGAGLDVIDPEPLPSDHPLWDMPNVLITSHYSGVVHDYSQRTERIFLRNLAHYIADEELESIVDKSAGY